jgi:uncharacterized protein
MPARPSVHCDPRSPMVLDIRELGRRPGSMRTLRRELAAPDGWGLNLVAVPVGTPVDLDVRLESVMEGVLVTGTARARVDAECGRCLDPLTTTLEVEVQELFAYDPEPQADDDVLLVDGDFIDLEPVLRDAVVLALPVNPVCDVDCAGLCAGCGLKIAELPADHAHDAPDPRWAALSSLSRDPDPEES